MMLLKKRGTLNLLYWFVVLVIANSITGFFTAWLAKEKGRDAASWFFLAFFFGVIALVTLGFAPLLSSNHSVNHVTSSDVTLHDSVKEDIENGIWLCPNCGQKNSLGDKRCFCGFSRN